MRILKENCAGLIIDVQEKLFAVMEDKENLLNNLLVLIKGLKILEVPLLFTQQYTRGLGQTLDDIAKETDMFRYTEKTAFSCCDEQAVMQKIASANKKNIIIAGIEAHVCILQTTTDLIEKGYQPVVAEDCISSRKPRDKKAAVERMRAEGAVITTYESLLFELTRYAGNEQFKAVSKLVK